MVLTPKMRFVAGTLIGGVIGLTLQKWVVDWYQRRWRERVIAEADRLDRLEEEMNRKQNQRPMDNAANNNKS